MSTLTAVIICILSAIGLAALIWSVAGAFMLPIRGGESCRMYVVLSAGQDCDRLPGLLRALQWFTDVGVFDYRIVVCDRGLVDEQRKAAELLSQRDEIDLVTAVTDEVCY